MVIKGKSISHAGKHAQHLLRTDQNDRVEILELDETSATPTVEAALLEYQTLAENLTNAKKGIYEVSLSPRNDEKLTPEQWEQAVDLLAEELGFTGQPRIVLLHEKEGREHVHAVFQRTDTENMKVISDRWNYPAHERAAREIERKFDLEPTIGAFTHEKTQERPVQDYDQAEHQQGNRTGIHPAEIRAEIKELFDQSKTGFDFVSKLEEQGYHLVRGDKKNIFMVLDPQQGLHRLSSSLKGHKMWLVNEKLNPLKPMNFNTASEAKEILKSQEHIKEQSKILEVMQLNEWTTLEANHQDQRARLEARHTLDNLAIEKQRSEKEKLHWIVEKVVKVLGDLTGYNAYQGSVRVREDRIRLAAQTQEIDSLKRDQLNERLEKTREHNQQFHQLDQENKPDLGLRLRFEVSYDERKLNELQEKLDLLSEHENQNTCRDGHLDKNTAERRSEKTKNNLKQDILADFAQIYLDPERAFENFNTIKEQVSVNEAIRIFHSEPEKYHELKAPAWNDRNDEPFRDRDQLVLDAALNLREYLDVGYVWASNPISDFAWLAGVDGKIVKEFESHGVAGHTKKIRWISDEQRLVAKQERISEEQYNENMSNRKLAIIREVQNAANQLDGEQWKKLDSQTQEEVKRCREIMNNHLHREIADELRQRKEREHERGLEKEKQLEIERGQDWNPDLHGR